MPGQRKRVNAETAEEVVDEVQAVEHAHTGMVPMDYRARFPKGFRYSIEPFLEPVPRILGSLVSPGDFLPERFADQYSAKATAVASIHNNYELNFNGPTQATAGLQLPPTDVGFFLFRDPLRFSVYYLVTQSNIVANYNMYAYVANFICPNSTLTNLPPGVSSPLSNFFVFPTGQTVRIDPTYFQTVSKPSPGPSVSWNGATIGMGPNSTWSPHGPILFPGEGNGRTGVWLDCVGGTTNQSAPGTTAATTRGQIVIMFSGKFATNYDGLDSVTVSLYWWNGSDWDFDQEQTYTNVSVHSGPGPYPYDTPDLAQGAGDYGILLPLSGSGYYAIDVRYNVGAAGSRTAGPQPEFDIGLCVMSGMQGVWAHQPLYGFTPALIAGNQITGIRMPGLSAWAMNVAPELYLSGSLVAIQADANEDPFGKYAFAVSANTGTPGSGMYNFLWGQNDQKQFSLRNGFFGYVKGTSVDSYSSWKSNIQLGSINLPSPTKCSFPLSPKDDYMVVAASVQNNQGAGDLQLRLNADIEFKTKSQLFECEEPDTTTEQWTRAMEIMRDMIQFYENPTHMDSILGTILATAGRYAAKHHSGHHHKLHKRY